MDIDIHNYKKVLQAQLRLLEEAKISARNKIIIKKFHDNCLNENLNYSRIGKYITYLREIAAIIKKDFDKATKQDIEKVIRYIQQTDFSEFGKKYDFKVTLKKFYKWLKGKNETYPDEVRWIKCTKKNGSNKLPEDLPTEAEVKKLIENAEYLRDKCLISLIYESGCRIAEVLTLKRKNVQFDNIGAVIIVNGKTGMRRVRLIASVPYLNRYYNEHPMADDTEAPLFVMLKQNKFLPYAAVRMMLKRLTKKAGIKKRITPHSFRHARATYLANKLTDAQLKDYLGWTQSSRMAATYIHMSGRDTDKAIQEVYGIKRPEEEKESVLKPKKCPRCNEVNAASSKFCTKCWLPLDIKTAMEEDEIMKGVKESPEFIDALALKYIENKAPEIIEKLIMKNPELLKKALASKK